MSISRTGRPTPNRKVGEGVRVESCQVQTLGPGNPNRRPRTANISTETRTKPPRTEHPSHSLRGSDRDHHNRCARRCNQRGAWRGPASGTRMRGLVECGSGEDKFAPSTPTPFPRKPSKTNTTTILSGRLSGGRPLALHGARGCTGPPGSASVKIARSGTRFARSRGV